MRIDWATIKWDVPKQVIFIYYKKMDTLKELKRIYNQRYIAKNKDKLKQKNIEYRQNNKTKIQKNNLAYRLKNWQTKTYKIELFEYIKK